MKAIQLTIDEELLRELDSSPEVEREGRSAVIRRATREYLDGQRRRAIAEQYRRGYADQESLEGELAGWIEEARWPEE